MSTHQFTFQDIDHPERKTVVTTEGLDERWALQEAVEQLKATSAEQAWQLTDTQLISAADSSGPIANEEDLTA